MQQWGMAEFHPIICVDDDADDLQLFSEAYKESGCKQPLLTFNNGLKMLEYVERHDEVQPSVIVVDWILSAVTAELILQVLKYSTGRKKIPVIILTTSNYPEIKSRALELGAAGFYTKPYTYSELVVVIREIVEQFCNTEPVKHQIYEEVYEK